MTVTRWRVRLYIGAMAVLGLAVVGKAAWGMYAGQGGYYWLLLASLTVVTGSWTIRVPGVNAKVSVAETLTFTNMVLFGVPAGILTAMLDGLTGSLRCRTVSRRLEYAVFNASAMAVSGFVSGELFWTVTGGGVLQAGVRGGANVLPGLGLLALSFYVCNSSFVALMVSIEEGKNFFAVWRRKFLWATTNYVAAAAVAGLLAHTEGAITGLLVATIVSVVGAIYVSLRPQLTGTDGAAAGWGELPEAAARGREIDRGTDTP